MKTMQWMLIPIIGILANLSVYAQTICEDQRYQDSVFATVNLTQDIFFANVDPWGFSNSQDLFLDLYEPSGDTLSQRPVILFAFGGSFLAGNKRQPIIPDYCDYYAKRGYVTVAIDYRTGFNVVSGESVERAVYRAVQDVRAALRYLAHHRQLHRIDTSSIFLTGTSAGCIAGLHSAYFQRDERPPSTYGYNLEPFDLGGVDSSGNTFFNNRPVPVRGVINHWGAVGDTSWIDPTPEDRIPCISFHGTADNVVPYVSGGPYGLPIWPQVYGSYAMHKRFDNMGIPNQLVTWEGAEHEPELNDPTYLDSMYMFTTPFLFDLLKPATPAISGNTLVCKGSIERYAVPGTGCWSVQGGVIRGSGPGYVDIQWTDSAGPYEITASLVNYLGAKSEDTTLSIFVSQPPVAGFSFTSTGRTFSFADTSAGAQQWFWDFGDGMTDSVSNPVHVYQDTGTYTVTLIARNALCADTFTTDIFIPSTTGISSVISKTEIQMYPHPVSLESRIEFPEALNGPKNLVLYNVDGKQVWNLEQSGGNHAIFSREGLSSGLYLMEIRTDGKRYLQKVLIR